MVTYRIGELNHQVILIWLLGLASVACSALPAWGPEPMYVAAARVALRIIHSHSLKEKRAVIRRLKARVQSRLHVGLSEVGALDAWQRAELGAAVVSGDRRNANDVLDAVIRMLAEEPTCELIAQHRDVMRLDAGDDLPTDVTSNRPGNEPAGTASSDATFSPPEHWLAAEDES